ncbi:hypothetical protein EIN_274250 [Entamoeba invadens IP1]|uniref:DDE Tnp4 domain-containing protein n=1 Tax=Entamoeba invadens IP1 TaxID=370355 RepID=A0A0A1U4P3_ENTIV|nr:hypothetical protein EIN_274250 [Entamoeba invadens IP1]ELP87858.1 hypothetical protein EIN_274250 [Entamoeba invadens IP1]|eukprot:XP_004254629.1 hypothetical protein EIN_274250 [Entamoeba invadens IP1]
MTLQFILFYLIYYCHLLPTEIIAYNTMLLYRFSNSVEESSKKRYAGNLLYLAIELFSPALYDSCVESLRLVPTNLVQPLSIGRSEVFSKIIENLENTIIITDGRNHDIPKQTVVEHNKKCLNTKYFNHKSNKNGVKSIVCINRSGYSVFCSNSYNAAVHDSNVFNMEFDYNYLGGNYYIMGDGGFMGVPRMICPYPQKCCESKCLNSYLSEPNVKCVIIGSFEFNESVWFLTIEVIVGFYGVFDKDMVFEGECKGITNNQMVDMFGGGSSSYWSLKLNSKGKVYIDETVAKTTKEYLLLQQITIEG